MNDRQRERERKALLTMVKGELTFERVDELIDDLVAAENTVELRNVEPVPGYLHRAR